MARNERERLTVSEAARQLGLSAKTVRNLIRRRELPAYRISERKTYVLRGELDAFIESRRTAPVTVPVRDQSKEASHQSAS